jgi:hypothetical protein
MTFGLKHLASQLVHKLLGVDGGKTFPQTVLVIMRLRCKNSMTRDNNRLCECITTGG